MHGFALTVEVVELEVEVVLQVHQDHLAQEALQVHQVPTVYQVIVQLPEVVLYQLDPVAIKITALVVLVIM